MLTFADMLDPYWPLVYLPDERSDSEYEMTYELWLFWHSQWLTVAEVET